MFKSKVLVSLVLTIYVLFVTFGLIGYETVAFTLDSLILPLIALFYFVLFEKKTLFFSLFIICYAGSDLIGLIVNFIPYNESYQFLFDLDYFIGNSMYIMAYGFLFIEICKALNVFHILRNFKIHLIVLTGLNIWLIFVLQEMVDSDSSMSGEYYLEMVYNIIMLLLLSGALLNYFYRDNKKTLLLFLGALCIVFSEVIDIAYIYKTPKCLLNIFSTTLTLSAFYFFCIQTNLSDVRGGEEAHVVME